MWSSSSIDLESVDITFKLTKQEVPKFEPNPYTFTKIENGKKTTADSTSLTPPNWLLLDHTIAVVWAMFSLSPTLQQLSIEDLKWAYEFLKRIKNKKGENPPDVKVCLKEIQDRLINLYAKLTSLKEEDFDEIAAAFGEKIIEDSTTSYFNTTFKTNKVESKIDTLAFSSRTPLSIVSRSSSKDITKTGKKGISNSIKSLPCLEEYSNVYEGTETGEDDEVEKYVLSLFENEKNDDSLQAKSSTKSLIPSRKKTPSTGLSKIVASQDTICDVTKTEKTSKRVHCFAEMRSLKFQKSMKLKDTNGEEAYSNLKAEIQKLTFNPNVSKTEVMKFLMEWRSEQVDRLHNELKRLSSIEEFMKTIDQEEVTPNTKINCQGLKQFDMEKSNYSWNKSGILQ